MNNFEVEEPISNSPYEEPALHWLIEEGRPRSHSLPCKLHCSRYEEMGTGGSA